MKVKLKEDINLKDLKENRWEGCMSWTLEFLNKYYDTETEQFEAEYDDFNEGGYKIYGTNIEKDYIVVNKKCFEIIEEDKKIRKIKVDYSPDIEEKIFYEDGDKPRHCVLGDAGTELLINKINEIIDYLEEKE